MKRRRSAATMSDGPHFLELHNYHLSRDNARCAVSATLERWVVKCPKEGWESLVLTFTDEKPPVSVSFGEMKDEARRTGIIRRLQRSLDKRDPIFGGTLDDFCTPNFQFTLKS